MSRTKVGDSISTIRKQIKALNKDAFVTDRFIYSLLIKHGAWLLAREDSKNKLLRQSSSFQPIPFIELIEVDKIEACCTGLKSECTIMRTKEKIPNLFVGYWGPILRAVTSIDFSEMLYESTPTLYVSIANSKNFKYNHQKYYWFSDGYLYFPNIDWPAVRIEGMFEEDISYYKCDPKDRCLPKQEWVFNIPPYLHAEMEAHVLRDDLLVMYQIPGDPTHDKQNPAR